MREEWPTVSAEELAALRPTRDYDPDLEDEHERLREQWQEAGAARRGAQESATSEPLDVE
jgi:hypothetical protein